MIIVDSKENVVLNSECLGSGDPLLLLHGWGHSLERIRPLGQLLASSAQVHLFDLPGFGKSAPPDGIWDTYDYADRLAAYMDELGLVKADFCGHSFGGKIALSMAIRHPHRVRRMILMASSGFRSRVPRRHRLKSQMIKWLGKTVRAVDALASTDFYQNRFVATFASQDYRQAGPMRAILVKTINDDLTDELAAIRCPTLILWGDQDTETPPNIAHHLHRHIACSELIFHPSKGHQLYDDVGAHLCAHHILSFLKKS